MPTLQHHGRANLPHIVSRYAVSPARARADQECEGREEGRECFLPYLVASKENFWFEVVGEMGNSPMFLDDIDITEQLLVDLVTDFSR